MGFEPTTFCLGSRDSTTELPLLPVDELQLNTLMPFQYMTVFKTQMTADVCRSVLSSCSPTTNRPSGPALPI